MPPDKLMYKEFKQRYNHIIPSRTIAYQTDNHPV